VQPGSSRISSCLTNILNGEEKGNDSGRRVSEECKKDVETFKVERSTNINLDLKLAEACKDDVTKFCPADKMPNEDGAVISCLREVKDKLSSMCQAEVQRTQEQASKDYKLDAGVHELCQSDAETLCKDVKEGEGRVQTCLRKKRASLSWDCQEELFRQEVENAEDWRLSAKLHKDCGADKVKFCKDVTSGNAKVKVCLEENREKPDFSASCKDTLERMMERRAQDFRLDVKLRENCEQDIEEVCGYEKDSLGTIANFDARVVECLQDYREELTVPECQNQVHMLTVRAGTDIRFEEPLADACFEDRQKLCDGIKPGDSRVIRCLQDNRDALNYECRATLFDQEVRLAQSIDFQIPMKRACESELAKWCKDVPAGHARRIKCLQSHVEDSEMGEECKKEVKRNEIRSATDYRLMYRLSKACDGDINNMCATVCSPFSGQACGGTVLRCLVDNRANITSDDCKKETFEFEKSEANDIRVDKPLSDACKEDKEKFCADVKPGMGRVHQCLRDHKDELTEACKKEEEGLNVVQSDNVLLRPGVTNACSEEIVVHCKGVQPGRGRLFKCLQENMAKVEFSQKCTEQIREKAERAAQFWKLDASLAAACKVDAQNSCAEASKTGHGNAEVLKCLAKNSATIAQGCSRELSRAVRMTLWQYRKGQALTKSCDNDVEKLCADQKKNGYYGIGVAGRCLANALSTGKALDGECKNLVELAAPKDAKAMFDGSMTAAAVVAKVAEIEKAAGMKGTLVNPGGKGASMVTLTGWIALASIASLIVVIVGLGIWGYRKYTGRDRPYTMVMKSGDA